VQARETSNPSFIFVISLGDNGDANLSGWHMKNNVVSYNQDGMSYGVRILTGRQMNKKDLDDAVGFDRATLATLAPYVYVLPLDAGERELIEFEAKPYDTLAELDKSFEASKKKDQQ
jgi:hypothetical protein